MERGSPHPMAVLRLKAFALLCPLAPQCPASRIQQPPRRPPTEGRTCEAAAAPCTTPSGPRRPRRRSRPTAGKWGGLRRARPRQPHPVCERMPGRLPHRDVPACSPARLPPAEHLAKSIEK